MPNQTVNKVEFGNQTIMDITDTSADANDVIEGEVFYNAAGTRTVGTLGDATTSTHGLMSAADKEKLNNIIDDTAGEGDTGQTWSADKLVNEFEAAEEAVQLSKVIDTPAQVVSFSDAAQFPMELQVGINPVQNLHGYDHPWPGGGGKNLLPLTLAGLKSQAGSGSWSGNAYSHNGITYTIMLDSDGNVAGINISGTASSFSFIRLCSVSNFNGSFVMNGGKDSNLFVYIQNETTNNQLYKTISTEDVNVSLTESSDTINIIVAVRESITVANQVIFPMLRLVTETDPTFEPYSNICSITGFDGANVMVTGKNLFKLGVTAINKTTEYRPNSTQRLNISEESNGDLKFAFRGGGWSQAFIQIDGIDGTEDYAFSFEVASNTTSYTPSITKDANQSTEKCLVIVINGNNRSTLVSSSEYFILTKIQVEKGTTATAYEPFSGTVYPITFPTSAGTVYGGKVTVNPDGTGELMVERAKVVVSTLTWQKHSSSANLIYYTDNLQQIIKKPKDGYTVSESLAAEFTNVTAWENMFFTGRTGISIAVTGLVGIAMPTISTVADFVSTVGSYSICYPLATPITYFLTPGQVLSLLEQNNVWADTGDIQSLSYVRHTMPELIRQDMKGQITSALSEFRMDIIDDTAADEETEKTWSADKLTDVQLAVTNNASNIAELNQAMEQVDDLTKDADVTGDIVTFEDGAEDVPLKTLRIGFDPVQDLHGYDHPWPAGGGKNLLNVTASSGKIYSIASNGVVTVDGTSDGNGLILGYVTPSEQTTYKLNGCPAGGGDYTYRLDARLISTSLPISGSLDTGSGSEFTASEPFYVFIRIPPNVIVSNKVFYPMLRLATETDSTFEPYSNICPITGRTGVEVTRMGKNLLQKLASGSAYGVTMTSNPDGSVSFSGTVTSDDAFYYANNSWLTLPAGTYILSGGVETGIVIRIGKDASGVTYVVQVAGTPAAFTLTEETAIRVGLRIQNRNGQSVSGTFYPMIRLASDTDATYEPYTGAVYPITFPSGAGTVYGGELTVNQDGTGELVVDRKQLILDGTEAWREHATIAHFYYVNNAALDQYLVRNTGVAIADKYAFVQYGIIADSNLGSFSMGVTTNGTSRLSVMAFEDTLAEWKSWLENNPIQIVYKIADPIAYTLTTEQVRTLLELNHIWTNDGDIEQLTYYLNKPINTDVQELREQIVAVQNSLVAPVLSDMIADTALVANDFRIVNETLYRITSPIASGGTLTPGTNCVATNLGEQLTALLNAQN